MKSNDAVEPRAFPQRRHFLAATALFVAIAIYGSFVPWNYTPIAFRDAVLRFKDLPLLDLGIQSRADWVANILLFVPIGFSAMAAAVVDRRKRILRDVLCGAAIWVACVALSFAIEFAQIWFPPRTTSQNDIQAECIGGAVGIVLARFLATPLAVWLRRARSSRRPWSRLVWLLQVYVVGLIVYEVLPLDITIHPRELWGKFKAGRIEIVPFATWRLDFDTLSGIVKDVLIRLPLGAWCALGPLAVEKRRGDLRFAVLWCVAIVVACEVAQVFVYSRYASTTDVIISSSGAALGAYLALRLTARDRVEPLPRDTPNRDFYWSKLATFAIVYTAFLCVVYWSPFEVLTDGARIERRLNHFLSVPFEKLYWGTEFNAVTQMLGKFFSFIPLGIAGALGARHAGCHRSGQRIVAGILAIAAAGAFGSAIELAQAIFPPHFPDVTDAIFYTAGAAAGFFLPLYVLGDERPPTADRT